MALKCDRCNYMESPVCVDVCPTKAIELVELENVDEFIKQKRRAVVDGLSAERKDGILILDLGN